MSIWAIGCQWCGVLSVDCLLSVVCIYSHTVYFQMYLCPCLVSYYIFTSPSYYIARHDFNLTMLYLSNDLVSLLMLVADLLLYLLLFICVYYCTTTVMCLVFYLMWGQVVECVDINIFTCLMLLCPNNNKVSLVSCSPVLMVKVCSL